MNEMTPTVYLIDDDSSILRALSRLIGTAGHRTQAYASAEDFLREHDPGQPGCAVLDLELPGIDGLELQQSLAAGGRPRQVIFLSGHGDISASVRAMKAGAVDFLTKPVDATELIAAVDAALERDVQARSKVEDHDEATRRLASLTPREREVMALVVQGRMNKQIAGELGIAERTTKIHRGRMMRKMGVRSVAELVQLVMREAG